MTGEEPLEVRIRTVRNGDVRIREVRDADLAALFALSLRCIPDESWTLEGLQEELKRDHSLSRVAELASGRLAGFVIAWQVVDEVHLLQIGTDPALQRQGIGQRLLDALTDAAHAASVVYLEVRASNQQAIGFYEHRGFACVGRRRNYYAKPIEDALLMALMLRPG
jgi:ribosomal-protein-alanine N-acetyltransferase